ncbi:MAG: hypothetical protein M1839_002001 [Geoglossum umbratile]|nr:MAG: hypothetical protein M1839_002001 [Geoglossum umbratile]
MSEEAEVREVSTTPKVTMNLGFNFIASLELVNEIRTRFVDAPDQFQAISDEIRSLSIILEDVKIALPQRDLTDEQHGDLNSIAGGCHNVLKALNETLEGYQELGSNTKDYDSKSFRFKVRRGWKSLRWEPDDIRELRSRITSNVSLLSAFNGRLTRRLSQAIRDDIASMQSEVRQIGNSVAELQFRIKDQETLDLLTWLSPLNFSTKQNDVFHGRQEGTGEWLLTANKFRDWLFGTCNVLWCPGIPGAGKTVLVSVIVDFLEQTFRQQNVAVAYIYGNYKEQNQTAVNLIGCLLRQLVQLKPDIPDDIASIYRHHVRKQTRLWLAEYSNLLQLQVRRFSKVYFVIDALDEYSENDGIRGFLPEVLKLLPDIHLLVTSRYNASIEFALEGVDRLEIRASDEDIRCYLNARIKAHPQFARFTTADSTLQNTILDTIIQKADGMFLLARLHMDSLEREDNRRDVYRALLCLPKELDTTYSEAMQRIRSQDDRKVRRATQVLSWISYAVRQLTVKEIQYALAIEPSDRVMDEEALPDIGALISVCAGLVTIDQNSNVIRLVHYTAQEYLERTRMGHFPTAQLNIAGTCLTYLSFDTFAGGYCSNDEEMEKRLQENTFLQYAASCWGYHARGSPEQDQFVRDLILAFFKQEPKMSCSIQVRHILQHRFKGYTQHFPRNVSGLQVAASFGLKEVVNMLTEKDTNIEAVDSNGMAALHSAALHGYEEVVKFLLEKGAAIDAMDNSRRTPLHLAASNGHVASVQILLEWRAHIDARTNFGETALYLATLEGRREVVRVLLKKGANPNLWETKHDMLPISQAAWEGHEAITRLLLDHGSEPDSKDAFGLSPLALAAENGRETVVRLLLDRDGVDPNSKDFYSRTPLRHAARMGHEAVVRALLERDDVDPDSRDKWGWTPLMQAGEKGHESIVRLLGPITSEGLVILPHPPLLQAAEDGDTAAVRSLIEREGINPNIKSSIGQTPLSLAARKGNNTTVQLLLSYSSTDLDSKCIFGRTALSWAAGNGHTTAVRLLLGEGVDLNSKSNSGRTPLLWASHQGHGDIVRLLLEERGIDVNAEDDHFGESALSTAVETGHEEIVRLLLENGADTQTRTRSGSTPLSKANYYGHKVIAQLLQSKMQYGN